MERYRLPYERIHTRSPSQNLRMWSIELRTLTAFSLGEK
jgi:hypothetical protein